MLLGKKNSFAISFELDENYNGIWMFGKICYWLDNSRLGNWDQAALCEVLYDLSRISSDFSNANFSREDRQKYYMPVTELLRHIHRPNAFSPPPSPTEDTWGKYNITLDVDTMNEWKVYAIEHSPRIRIISLKWEEVTSQYEFFCEKVLLRDEVCRTFHEASKILSEIYDMESISNSSAHSGSIKNLKMRGFE